MPYGRNRLLPKRKSQPLPPVPPQVGNARRRVTVPQVRPTTSRATGIPRLPKISQVTDTEMEKARDLFLDQARSAAERVRLQRELMNLYIPGMPRPALAPAVVPEGQNRSYEADDPHYATRLVVNWPAFGRLRDKYQPLNTQSVLYSQGFQPRQRRFYPIRDIDVADEIARLANLDKTTTAQETKLYDLLERVGEMEDAVIQARAAQESAKSRIDRQQDPDTFRPTPTEVPGMGEDMDES